MTTTLIRCPGCNQFRRPGPTCPTCETRRQQRRLRRRRIATFALTLTLIALLGALLLTLTACSDIGAGDTTGIQPPPRRSLSEIRAQALGQTQTLNPAPAAQPAQTIQLIPAPLPPDETDWALHTLGIAYRWCSVIDGQPVLIGNPDGPRTSSELCK